MKIPETRRELLLRRVAEQKQRVDLQRRLVSQLERDGLLTVSEKDVLLQMQESLAAMESEARRRVDNT